MTYRIKRRGILGLLAISLIAVVTFMGKGEYNRISRDGSYMDNLCFVLGNSVSEQTIFCFTDAAEQISYLFLPSYAKQNEVRIFFSGAERVVFSGKSGEIPLINGEGIGALDYNEKYDMYFCGRRGERLEKQEVVIMHSENLPAVFLETDSGSMNQLDADKNYAEKEELSCLIQMGM